MKGIRAATGEDFVISFRFSQFKEVDYGVTIASSPEELRDRRMLAGKVRRGTLNLVGAGRTQSPGG